MFIAKCDKEEVDIYSGSITITSSDRYSKMYHVLQLYIRCLRERQDVE